MADTVERSVLVTGSGSGIGAATVRRLAGPGVGVVIHALANGEGCERVAKAARDAGAQAVVKLGDLADPEVARGLVDTAVEAFGGLGVLVANAGFPDFRGFGQLDREGLDYCHRAITEGFFHMATRALPHLQAAGTNGRVVTVSTLNAHVYRATFPVYPASAAAKAGLESLTRSLAVELAPHGVTVNCVAPGIIEKDAKSTQFYDAADYARLTANIPLGRIGQPGEVAAMVAFLAGPEAGYVTGQVIHVNGGIA